MAISSQELSEIVFERTFGEKMGEISMEPLMLQFLVEVDGKRTVGKIVDRLDIRLLDARPVLAKLIKAGLIRPRKRVVAVLDRTVFPYLNRRLAMAVGPFARILIEDILTEMGLEPERFPAHQAAFLIEQLARNIENQDQRTAFVRDMLERIGS